MSARLNFDFCIERENLEDRIQAHLDGNISFNKIIPLREIREITQISFLRKKIFEALIRSIPLRGDKAVFPYAHAVIDMYGIEPKALKVGQTFVLKSKLLNIMSDLNRFFKDHITKGLSKMPPAQIYGLDSEGKEALAFYVPPIVELHNYEGALLDGMHRSYICSSAGTTICGVHIKNISAPLPFDPITWEDVSLVDIRPIIEERYVNLKKEYFRDLGQVGIDG